MKFFFNLCYLLIRLGRLAGMGLLRQEGGPKDGALHHLFQHLKFVHIEVGCISMA